MNAVGTIRRVVAERLGVEVEELTPEVSLVDDLAADSLDVLELAVALEDELGVSVPEPVLRGIRTYRDLVEAVQVSARLAAGKREPSAQPPRVSAVVVSARDNGHAKLRRSGLLTPYTVEMIVEDALRAGRGACLELTLPPGLGDAEVSGLRRHLVRLDERGVQVRIHGAHAQRPAPLGRPSGVAGAFVGSP
jgi:acyl carrier protein